MIEVDATKTQMETTHQVDKVAMYSSTTDSSGDGIGIGGSFVAAAASSLPFTTITTASVPNPYGKKCLMTLSWSVDNINYHPMNVPIFYFNASYNSYFWRALAAGGCSDDTIYFSVTSQYDQDQIIYFQFALDSPT